MTTQIFLASQGCSDSQIAALISQSHKPRKTLHGVSDNAVIIAHYSTWYVQEPGQDNYTRIQSFPIGDDPNEFRDVISALPNDADFKRTAKRIQ